MNIKLTVSALFLSAAALAQDFTMEWGPKVKTKNSIGTIHVVNENSFYAESYNSKKKQSMLYYENLSFKSNTLYNPVVNDEKTDFEEIYEINGTLYVFSSQDNKERNKKTLYAHEFKRAPEYIKIEGKAIASFEYDSKNKRRTSFKITTSEDRKKLCVTYYSNPKKEKNT